jgi:hypothetical protein
VDLLGEQRLDKGLENLLTNPLEGALVKIADGAIASAVEKLEVFIAEVSTTAGCVTSMNRAAAARAPGCAEYDDLHPLVNRGGLAVRSPPDTL